MLGGLDAAVKLAKKRTIDCRSIDLLMSIVAVGTVVSRRHCGLIVDDEILDRPIAQRSTAVLRWNFSFRIQALDWEHFDRLRESRSEW
jgi:hypothetical protein